MKVSHTMVRPDLTQLKDALRGDMLVPIYEISLLATSYLKAVGAPYLPDEGRDALMHQARRALRRYENARKLTVFQMGVSSRSEEAKSDLIDALHQLSSRQEEDAGVDAAAA